MITVMIVDDQRLLREGLQTILQSEEGIEVAALCGNGQEAVQTAARLRPKVVLMDIKMPVMDGLKAARLIRKFSDAAIVMLTAYSEKEFVEQACAADAAAYVVKPVSEERLIPAIEVALRARERLRSIENAANERKLFERAKGMLMSRRGISEEEAHRWLQRESMDGGVPLSKVAERVLRGEL